ncbi:MAG: hypothetical protein ACKV2Q_35010 [Planctomycetaceae bacterium]
MLVGNFLVVLRRTYVIPACALIVLAFSNAVCRATDDSETISRITLMWARRLDAVHKVRYHLSGDATYLKGGLLRTGAPDIPRVEVPAAGLPEADSTHPLRVVWLFDFASGLLRKESRDWSYVIDRRSFRPIVRTDVFNGRELKGLIPRSENSGGGHVPLALDADFEIGSEKHVPWFVNLADTPIFFAHGLFRFLPTRLRDGGHSNLPTLTVVGHDPTAPNEDIVILSAITRHNSRPDVVVEQDQRFWVDLSKGGAIVRWEDRYDSELDCRVTIQWKTYGNHWLPAEWTHTEYQKSRSLGSVSTPKFYYRYQVERVELEPDVERQDFDVRYEPGMLIHRLEDDTRLRVAADGRTLEPVAIPGVVPPAANLVQKRTTIPQPTVTSMSLWLVVGNMLAVVYLLLRFRVFPWKSGRSE